MFLWCPRWRRKTGKWRNNIRAAPGVASSHNSLYQDLDNLQHQVIMTKIVDNSLKSSVSPQVLNSTFYSALLFFLYVHLVYTEHKIQWATTAKYLNKERNNIVWLCLYLMRKTNILLLNFLKTQSILFPGIYSHSWIFYIY